MSILKDTLKQDNHQDTYVADSDRKYCMIGKSFIKSDFEYAKQYKVAFDLLFNTSVDNRQISMPMLFLLHHYFELILKYNIQYFMDKSGENALKTNLNNTHNLIALRNAFYQHWNAIKKLYPELLYEKEKVAETKFHKNLNSIIDILSSMDKDSSATRFFKDKQGNVSLGNKIVNLKLLKELTDSVVPYLNNIIEIFKRGVQK